MSPTPTLTRAPEVARYLEAVRTHLGGVPAEERAELLDDLEAHLNEVAAAEPDLPLEQRLGPPEAFAADLLASAGLAGTPAPDRPPRPGLRDRLLAQPGVQALQAHPWWQQAAAFLPELRPGWWVLRGWLVVMVLSAPDVRAFPFPRSFGSTFVGLCALAVAIPASVWWARQVAPRRPQLTTALNVALVVVALMVAGEVRGRAGGGHFPVYDGSPGAPGLLTGPDGTSITNIQPYGADGRPLQGVALYDQDGRPVETALPYESRGNVYPLPPQPRAEMWDGGGQLEQAPETPLAPPATSPTTALPPTSSPAPAPPPASPAPAPAEPPR